ncbi:porin [Paraburkholderia graminis]|uniref:porin n=1 Tax=Paraburkholderia graminis TaxID=60548 RepID=UPI003CA7EB36
MKQRFNVRRAVCLMAVSSAVSPLAKAQSSVTLYGVADIGIEVISHVPTGAPGGGAATQVDMFSGGLMFPRVGVTGREDLSGGWAAVFKLETYYTINNGALWRNIQYYGGSWVGVNSPYGQLQVGRNPGLFYDFQFYYDPGLVARYSLSPFDAAFAGRPNNSVKYISSAGPFTLSALYSFGYTGTDGVNGQVPGVYKVGKEESLRVNYAGSVLAVGAAYDHQNGTTVTTQSDVNDRGIVAASLTFGPSRTIVGFRYLRSTVGEAIAINKIVWAGEVYTITPALTTCASYYRTFNAGSNSAISDYVAVLVDYSLSKQTDVYFNAGYVRNRGGATLGLVPAQLVGANVAQTGAMVGIRQRF